MLLVSGILFFILFVDAENAIRPIQIPRQAPFSASSPGIRDASLYLLAKMATPEVCPPYTDHHGRLDENLYKKISNAIIVYMADSARAEQLAGEMLMYDAESFIGDTLGDGTVLPGLKKVGQDKTHGVRRRSDVGKLISWIARGWVVQGAWGIARVAHSRN